MVLGNMAVEHLMYSINHAYLVLLEQVLDSPSKSVHFGVFAFHHFAHIHGHLAHADAVRGHVVSRLVVQVGRMQKGLPRVIFGGGGSSLNCPQDWTEHTRVRWNSFGGALHSTDHWEEEPLR